jgi:1,4-dihydroxy-2-naphthoate polyprenyltransferase
MHSTKSESPISPASPSALKTFFLASRPKTWSAGISPVLIGGALAARHVPLSWDTFLLTLFFSLFIQIGTNFANDYFDFLKGADTSERKGPKRAVSAGWIAPKAMLRAALFTFALALFVALPLVLGVGLWSFGLAALCVLFGILYTGGPKPLGYAGLGEILVLIFYGPVAVMGTYFLQTGEIDRSSFLASLAPGFLSAAILMANNLRDVETDRIANKKTLVVRFGTNFGKGLYTALIFCAFLVPLLLSVLGFPASIAAASFVLLFAPFRKIFNSQEALQETSLTLLAYTLVFVAALWSTI